MLNPAELKNPFLDAQRLRNWGRWCRVWEAQGRTPSLEGNYRAGRDEEEKYGVTRSRPLAPDAFDAWAIECAMRYLPLKHHLLLALRYVSRCHEIAICKALRVARCGRYAPHELPAVEGMAWVLLAAALEMPAVVRNQHVRRKVRAALRLVLTNSRRAGIVTVIGNSDRPGRRLR